MSIFSRRNSEGFTLVELLIVVMLISIILGVSIPGYRQYVQRAQRADATTALLRLAAAQERFYMQAGQYASGAAQVEAAPPAGLGFTSSMSERGYYSLAVAPDAGGAAVGYDATATPVAGGNQATDSDCTSFGIDESGTRTSLPGNIDKCWR